MFIVLCIVFHILKHSVSRIGQNWWNMAIVFCRHLLFKNIEICIDAEMIWRQFCPFGNWVWELFQGYGLHSNGCVFIFICICICMCICICICMCICILCGFFSYLKLGVALQRNQRFASNSHICETHMCCLSPRINSVHSLWLKQKAILCSLHLDLAPPKILLSSHISSDKTS